LLFIGAARSYRGEGRIGDLFIPLAMLSLGTSWSQWGFEFQFLSSMLFSAAFLFFAVRSQFVAAFVALFLCAWSGLNGMLISTVVSVGMACFFGVRRVKVGWKAGTVLAVTVMTNVALWLAWTPSAVSSGPASFGQFAGFVFGMINSPLMVYVFPTNFSDWPPVHPLVKLAIMLLLVAAGTAAAFYSVARDRSTASAAVFFTVVAAGILVVSTAYGRAKVNPWLPGQEGHYGIIAVLLPVSAWIALSSLVGRKTSLAAGVVLVALFGRAYWASYDWRRWEVTNDGPVYLAARLAIAGDAPASVVADTYIKQYGTLTPEPVVDGIVRLRGVSGYGPK
jgi:hypothetical protein